MSIIAHVYNPQDAEFKVSIDVLHLEEIPVTGNFIQIKKDNQYVTCKVRSTAFPDTTNYNNKFLFIQKIREYKMEPPELDYIIIGYGLPASSTPYKLNVLDKKEVMINGSPMTSSDSIIIDEDFYRFSKIVSNDSIGITANVYPHKQSKKDFILEDFLG